jgi:hypothetical protein
MAILWWLLMKNLMVEALSTCHERFNTQVVAKARISSEHTIGMLKSRFPLLRSICLPVTQDKESMHIVLQLISATIVLHNMLIDMNNTTSDLPQPEVDDCVPQPKAHVSPKESTVPASLQPGMHFLAPAGTRASAMFFSTTCMSAAIPSGRLNNARKYRQADFSENPLKYV